VAEKVSGRFVRIELGGVDRPGDSSLLSHLVAGVDCVMAHSYETSTRTLTAYIEPRDTDEDDLLRIIASTRMYPIRRVRVDEVNGAGGHVC
jgi:hypothetical protein